MVTSFKPALARAPRGRLASVLGESALVARASVYVRALALCSCVAGPSGVLAVNKPLKALPRMSQLVCHVAHVISSSALYDMYALGGVQPAWACRGVSLFTFVSNMPCELGQRPTKVPPSFSTIR